MILFPPLRHGPKAEPIITEGEGFRLYEPPGGEPWIVLSNWSVPAERILGERRATRVTLSNEWSEKRLPPFGSVANHITELTIATSTLLDLAVLPDFANLTRLRLHDCVQSVPFAELRQLRECEIMARSPKALGSVGQAPGLEALSIADVELRDLEVLRSLPTLRKLDLRGMRKLVSLAGIETLKLEWLELRLPALRTIENLRTLPLRHLLLEGAKSLEHAELLADISSLETLKLLSVAPLNTLQFLSRLSRLQQLTVAGTPVAGSDGSVAYLTNLGQLRELSLVGGKANLQNLTDLEVLAKIRGLELLHLHRGPKQIDTIRWVSSLEALRAFRLQGTKIADGDLTPLLRLPSLESIAIDPVGADYSHTDASFAKEFEMVLANRGS